MNIISKIIICYYTLINTTLFALMGYDKSCARKNKWRVPESTLFIISLLGGGIGGFLGMFIFHHKNRKPYFIMIYGMAVILHMAVLSFFFTGF